MPPCSRFHVKFNGCNFQQGRQLLWCCLPRGEPLVLAVSTPETGLGQSQGHPRLKSFLATKSWPYPVVGFHSPSSMAHAAPQPSLGTMTSPAWAA